jgi:hypothetical protein
VTASGDLLCARKNRGRGYTLTTFSASYAKRCLIDQPGSHALKSGSSRQSREGSPRLSKQEQQQQQEQSEPSSYSKDEQPSAVPSTTHAPTTSTTTATSNQHSAQSSSDDSQETTDHNNKQTNNDKSPSRTGSGHSAMESEGHGLLGTADDMSDAVSFLNHELEASSRPSSAAKS